METNSYLEGRNDEKKDIIKIVDEVLDRFIHGDNPPYFSINEDNIWEFKEELLKEIINPKNKSAWVKNKK